jgi:trans-aconitate methyltransferase
MNPQSFDHLSARYDRIATLLGAELRAWLLFHLPGGSRAVDLGCGTGVWTDLLAERYAEVTAVDLSAPMIAYARAHRTRPNVEFVRADLRDVRGAYDLVLSAYTLHHLPEFDAALYQLRTLVAVGGTVLLVDLVDERCPVPRSWLRAQAWRRFRSDLRHSPRRAVELLRLQLDRDWLDHQSTDLLRPAEEWDAHARAVFPGATIVPLHRARALAWTAPAGKCGGGSTGP